MLCGKRGLHDGSTCPLGQGRPFSKSQDGQQKALCCSLWNRAGLAYNPSTDVHLGQHYDINRLCPFLRLLYPELHPLTLLQGLEP